MTQPKVNDPTQVTINTDVLTTPDQEAIKQKMFNYRIEEQPKNLPFLMKEKTT